MPKTNQPEDLSARDAASQPEEQPQADAPAEEKKPDLFDYLESQPDVEDPFPPSEPEPEPEEPTDTELLAGYIRTRSAQGQLTARKALLEENPEMEPVIDELLQDEAFPDIRTEKGEKDVYYYATPIMAVHYAHLAMLAEEKDLPRTIADMVRHHCKIGPAPTPVTYFTASPYNCTIPQIDRALMTMKHRAEYADIQEVLSYNHVRYLFSSSIISAKYAKSLADFSEESAEIQ